jgi:ketosteroid isomerase-like protein
MHKLSYKLKFCEKEPSDAKKIEKTLSTMLPAQMILQQQYREVDTGQIAVTTTAADGTSERVAGKYLAVMKRVGNDWKIAYHMQTIEPR